MLDLNPSEDALALGDVVHFYHKWQPRHQKFPRSWEKKERKKNVKPYRYQTWWVFKKNTIISWGYPRPTNSGVCEAFFRGSFIKMNRLLFHWHRGWGISPNHIHVKQNKKIIKYLINQGQSPPPWKSADAGSSDRALSKSQSKLRPGSKRDDCWGHVGSFVSCRKSRSVYLYSNSGFFILCRY